MNRGSSVDIHRGYRTRVLGSTIFTLLVMIALVRFWPAPRADEDPGDALFDVRGREVVEIEMIQPTRQVRQQPPPPRPLPPIVVPDDMVLEVQELELTDEISPFVGEGTEVLEGESARNTGPAFIARADEAPKPVRFVEPEYSREARRENIQAQIVVEVRVDEEGRVQESRILDRYLLRGPGQPPEPVSELGFGVEEAVLAAAERWRFVPARHNGRVVQSLATLEFTIGR